MPATAAFTPLTMVPALTAPRAVVDSAPIEPLLATFRTSAPVSAEPLIWVITAEIAFVVEVRASSTQHGHNGGLELRFPECRVSSVACRFAPLDTRH